MYVYMWLCFVCGAISQIIAHHQQLVRGDKNNESKNIRVYVFMLCNLWVP